MNPSGPSPRIEIRTITIDSKKLTKTLFSQIEQRSFFNRDLEFSGDHIYGYVMDKQNRYLLWLKDGHLRRTNLSPYYDLDDLANNIYIGNVSWFLTMAGIDFHVMGNKTLENCIEDPGLYQQKVAKVKAFIRAAVRPDQQIFL
jgi:hypothetical protein